LQLSIDYRSPNFQLVERLQERMARKDANQHHQMSGFMANPSPPRRGASKADKRSGLAVVQTRGSRAFIGRLSDWTVSDASISNGVVLSTNVNAIAKHCIASVLPEIDDAGQLPPLE
jgi:hypothetical protein